MPRPANHIDAQIGANLKVLRERAGLTTNECAKAINESQKRFEQYEQGSARISARHLFILAGLLRVSISDFFKGVREP